MPPPPHCPPCTRHWFCYPWMCGATSQQQFTKTLVSVRGPLISVTITQIKFVRSFSLLLLLVRVSEQSLAPSSIVLNCHQNCEPVLAYLRNILPAIWSWPSRKVNTTTCIPVSAGTWNGVGQYNQTPLQQELNSFPAFGPLYVVVFLAQLVCHLWVIWGRPMRR